VREWEEIHFEARHHEVYEYDADGEIKNVPPAKGLAVSWRGNLAGRQYGDYVFVPYECVCWPVVWEAFALVHEHSQFSLKALSK
jgi:hypothetical protein